MDSMVRSVAHEALAAIEDPKRRIAARVAMELRDGDVVNLGIGLPTLVADHLPPGARVFLHTENGMLGVGPSPDPGEEDPDLVNAGKLPVTEQAGAAYFSSADSFAMIRGGHVDVVVLGTLQVDQRGRIANWSAPGRPVLGVGGAMDLLTGSRRVIIATTHTTPAGVPKLVPECRLPLTGERPADLVVTDLAVFAVRDGGLRLQELMPGATLDDVRLHTQAAYTVSQELQTGSG